MNFAINNLVLWASNGKIKNFAFEEDKINVITGGSGTGKSSLLGIIDYCLCATEPDIPFEIINENIAWYGLSVTIGSAKLVIARGKVEEGNKSSTSYYLSSEGLLPVMPEANINEDEIKSLLQKLFNIDINLKISYGGRSISANSKISFRYFLLFSTQSDKVITNKDQFFDKIEKPRYRESLDRIFDLVLGVYSQEDLLRKSQIDSLRSKNNKIDRQEKTFSKQKSVFENKIISLVSEAQSYGLIESALPSITEGVQKLQDMVRDHGSSNSAGNEEFEELYKQKRDLSRRIRNAISFKREYQTYKDNLSVVKDSLEPIEYLRNNFSQIAISSETSAIINALEEELSRVKDAISSPVSLILVRIDKELSLLEAQLQDIEDKIQVTNNTSKFFKDQIDKYVFIGQVKAMLSIYVSESVSDIFNTERDKNNALINKINADLKGSGDRSGPVDRLQELIQVYLDASKDSLDNYAGYKALINYGEKSLLLRAPNSSMPTKVGSSSNHMFLHLCFFLGMHEYFLERGNSYVPQFLIIDQLSRPYYERPDDLSQDELDELKRARALKRSDKSKLVNAFALLDLFSKRAKEKYSKSFQFILIEHVKPSMWTDAKLENFHLVTDLQPGEGIITSDMIDTEN
jgi:energy-coupling factor transporter ATP-binding protein EcfA2